MARLIDALDSLGARPSLAAVDGAIQSADLAPNDFAPFVKEDPVRYHRARVVRRDSYELLVMTWLPGQASVPHDHGGSICSMRVLAGCAEERTYEMGADGFVQACRSERFECGTVTSGDDAAIHSVHHAGGEGGVMVSLHVYAPPLGDFRKFLERPAPAASSVADTTRVVAVIGGGFTGSMVVANLLARAKMDGRPLRVHLVDRRGTLGEGVAYGTHELEHLLNVPAGKMSAWADRPDDFVEWMRGRGSPVGPGDFVPRMRYGDYIRDTLLQHSSRHPPGTLVLHAEEARRAQCLARGGWSVHLAHGKSIRCDQLVLATGHRPPADPLTGRWQGPRDRWIADPWQPHAVSHVEADEPVVILGSGLSAIDVLLSLHARRHRTAPVWLISRHGRLPLSHARHPVVPRNLDELVRAWEGHSKPRLRALVRSLRRAFTAEQHHPDWNWRSVVDGLRPHTQRIWGALGEAERSRFLRHVQPLWEVLRHRTAPEIGDRLAALRQAHAFEVLSGRVASVEADSRGVRLQMQVRGSHPGGATRAIQAGWIINCTGPRSSGASQADPLIGSLLHAGWVTQDQLGLGLMTDGAGCAIDAKGQVLKELLVAGTLRKAQLWESTAVPELRLQAAQVAEQCVAHGSRTVHGL